MCVCIKQIFYIIYLYIKEKLSFLELCTKVHPELMEKVSSFLITWGSNL